MIDQSLPDAVDELRCANCNRQLDATDKFCRECGLPTIRRAANLRTVAEEPPDTREFRLAMDAVPDPRPFIRPAPGEPLPVEVPRDLTTGGVIKATSPTLAAQLASSTLLMVGLVLLLAAAGIFMLVLAFQS